MFELNRYCFLSDMINYHILIYNSQYNSMAILSDKEYYNLTELVNRKNSTLPKGLNVYCNSHIIVKSNNNVFDENLFDRKIQAIRKQMCPFVTYLIVMEKPYNDVMWKIDNREFENCIIAIKNYCELLERCELLIVLQYHQTPSKEIIEEIISKELNNIDYKVSIRILDQQSSLECEDENVQNDCEQDELSKIYSCNKENDKKTLSETSNISDDLPVFYSYSLSLTNHSFRNYTEAVKVSKLFKKSISFVELLCPNLMENFYIIEHAKLVKKCLCQFPSHNNIIGVISNQSIIFNEYVNDYIMSTSRLNNECFDCRYVYVCMGQNCRKCLNNRIVKCMPLGRFITENLNEKLKELLHGAENENKSY